MPTDLEEHLREVMRRLAQAPAPPGLAEAAMRRARRQRRMRTAVGAAAAVALVSAAATVVVRSALPASDGPPPTQVVAEPSSPVEKTPVLIAGTPTSQVHVPGWTRSPLVVVAYAGVGGSVVFDPETGGYVEIPYLLLALSPDGTRMLVQAGDGRPDDPYRVGVLDLDTLEVVGWVEGYTGPASWSPDGREFVVVRSSQSRGSGFAVVDAYTLAAVDVPLDLNGQPLAWTPDGEYLGVTITEPAGDERLPDRVVGVSVYDRSGQLQRTLPATAALHDTGDFSPDGTAVALYDYFGPAVTIVDAVSGAVRHEIALTGHIADNLGWLDDSHLLLLLSPGLDQPSYLAVVDLTGTVVETVELPDPIARADWVWVRAAKDLGTVAAPLAF